MIGQKTPPGAVRPQITAAPPPPEASTLAKRQRNSERVAKWRRKRSPEQIKKTNEANRRRMAERRRSADAAADAVLERAPPPPPDNSVRGAAEKDNGGKLQTEAAVEHSPGKAKDARSELVQIDYSELERYAAHYEPALAQCSMALRSDGHVQRAPDGNNLTGLPEEIHIMGRVLSIDQLLIKASW